MTVSVGVVYGHVASNLGDLAINAGICELLLKRFGAVRLKVVLLNARASSYLETAKASFAAIDGVQFIHFSSSRSSLLKYSFDPESLVTDMGLGDVDLVVYNPGEHLFSYESWNNDPLLAWRLLPLLGAKISGKKCIIPPSTFGPFQRETSAGSIKSILSILDAIAAREPLSGAVLQRLDSGFSATTLPDVAFLVKPPSLVGRDPDVYTLGLVLRLEGYGLRVGKEESRRAEALALSEGFRNSLSFRFGRAVAADFFRSRKARIRLLVQTSADKVLAENLAKALAVSEPRMEVDICYPSTVEEYVRELSRLDHLVSNRFHAVILSAVAGVPASGFYYREHGEKMPGLFRLLESPDLCMELQENNINEVAARCVTAAASSDLRFPEIKARVEVMARRLDDWLHSAYEASRKPSVLELASAYRDVGRLASSLVAEDWASRERSLKEKIKALKVDLGSSEKELDKANRALCDKEDEKTMLAKQLHETQRELALAVRRAQQLEASFSFRLGHAIVRLLRMPASLFLRGRK